MAPKNLASRKRRRPQEEEDFSRADCDSQSGAAEEAAAPLRKQPPRKPKFAPPFKQPEPEPVENGSACSSPSASGFIVVPHGEKEKEKKMKMIKSTASKVFSDDDEIALLKGLAVFWANGRNNKWAEFHLSVKDDLGKHYTKVQLSEKIRTLKRKFDKNLARANEGEIDLSDPHESALFELSKTLWGDDKGIAPEKEKMSENGDMEVKGQMGGNENRDNEVKGQIDENGNEEVNEMLTGTEQVVENDGSKKKRKKKKKQKQVGEGEPIKEITIREQGFCDSFEEGDLHDAANTILSIRKLLHEHGEGSKEMEVDGEGKKELEVDGEGKKESNVDGEGKKETIVDGEGKKELEVNSEGKKESNVDGEGKKETIVNGEGSKELEVDGVGKKDSEVDGEGNKESELDGKGNKKSRKKKRKRGSKHDEEKELVNEGMQVDGQDEGDKDGERNKKTKKTKLVEECGDANKIAGEQKEVDEHAAKVEISEEVNRVEQHDEEEDDLLKEGKQVDENEQQDKNKKRKQVGGHVSKKDLAKQRKQVDDHAEEHHIPAKRKQKIGIRVDDFQSAYPMLYASCNSSGYPKVPMDKWVLIGRENAEDFEQKWWELKAEEHRLELKKIELMISRGKRS